MMLTKILKNIIKWISITLLILLIDLVLFNCSKEKVLSRAEKPIEELQPTTKITDTVSCIPADTTPKLYPIEFTVEVKDWENVN